MSRKSKQTDVTAIVAELTNAGWHIDGENYFHPGDTNFEEPRDMKTAYAEFKSENGPDEDKPKRSSENRASAELVALTRSVCQAYSNNFTQKYSWGEEEISMKKVVASTVQAWCVSKYAQENCQAPSEKQVKNAINSLKRQGEIITTQKGHFRASAQASVDWSKFV